jgi:hypothetical protein
MHLGEKVLKDVKCFCTIPKGEIPYVKQEDPSGCGIAALAMCMQMTYAEVRAMFHQDYVDSGIDDWLTEEILSMCGFAYAKKIKRFNCRVPKYEKGSERKIWPPKPWAKVHYCVVLNLSETGAHAVVMLEDGRVFDPWWGEVEGLHKYKKVEYLYGITRIK